MLLLRGKRVDEEDEAPEGEREREITRDGERLRGGKEFLILFEASNATICREQGPNKLFCSLPQILFSFFIFFFGT